MRRIFPLLLILLLLCGCGGNRDAAAPEDADRLVIFTARSAAVYDDAHASIFDVGQRYGMQLVWIGASAFIAVSILLIDDKYYHVLAYPLY